VERIFDSRGKGQRRWGVLVTVLVVDVDDDEVVVVVSPAIDVEIWLLCAIGIATGLDGEPGADTRTIAVAANLGATRPVEPCPWRP